MTHYNFTKSLFTSSILAILILANNNIEAMTRIAYLATHEVDEYSKWTKTHENDTIYIIAVIIALALEFAIFVKMAIEVKKKSFPYIFQYLSKDSLVHQRCFAINANLTSQAIDSCKYIESILKSLAQECENAASCDVMDSFTKSIESFGDHQKIKSAINIILLEKSAAVKQNELTFIINAIDAIISQYKNVNTAIA
ncbi:MAG: hypothetical protein P4L31_00610 [Candidatus Babeliales bacterium]|nr:hypothetical protein [Candidatus Babeliales bacterium]